MGDVAFLGFFACSVRRLPIPIVCEVKERYMYDED